jgi:hypothetical protein
MVFSPVTHTANAARLNRECMAHMDRLFHVSQYGTVAAFAPASPGGMRR